MPVRVLQRAIHVAPRPRVVHQQHRRDRDPAKNVERREALRPRQFRRRNFNDRQRDRFGRGGARNRWRSRLGETHVREELYSFLVGSVLRCAFALAPLLTFRACEMQNEKDGRQGVGRPSSILCVVERLACGAGAGSSAGRAGARAARSAARAGAAARYIEWGGSQPIGLQFRHAPVPRKGRRRDERRRRQLRRRGAAAARGVRRHRRVHAARLAQGRRGAMRRRASPCETDHASRRQEQAGLLLRPRRRRRPARRRACWASRFTC